MSEITPFKHNGREAWATNSYEFTKIEVGKPGPIIWDDDPKSTTYNTGKSMISLSLVLKDEIKEWMTEKGYEYDLTSDDNFHGALLIMFDLDAMLLFKLTWRGVT